jgi:hypothetical protein
VLATIEAIRMSPSAIADRSPIGHRLDVDCVSTGVKAVAGFDRPCLQVFGAVQRR